MKNKFKIIICSLVALCIVFCTAFISNNDIKNNLVCDDRGGGSGLTITPQSAPTNPVPTTPVTEDGTSTTV